MGATMTILVVLGALGLLMMLGFAFGMFRPAKTEEESKPTLDDLDWDGEKYPEEDGLYPYQEPSALDMADELQRNRQEAQDLFSYFSDDPEEEASAQSPEPEPEEEHVPEELELNFDKLCGFKVGRGFQVECRQRLKEAKNEGRQYALVCFDFDRFRFINSLKGHSIGDYAITRMAQEMQEVFPVGASCSRISADHFVALFPRPEELVMEDYAEQIRRIADRLREDIGAKSGLHVSMGVAYTLEQKDYDYNLLLEGANIARHCMKLSKNDLYGVFDDTMLTTYLYGESSMEDYAENQYNDEFEIYYQPLADMKKGRITACEALVRWNCVVDTFREIPVTPDNGWIPTNGLKLIYHVCHWMGRQRKAGKEVVLSCVRLAATDLYKENIDEFFIQCLHDFQVEGKNLMMVVEASAVRLNWGVASGQLKKIRDLGVRIAIGGLDRSCNSLEFLAGLPADYVKFRKSLIQDIEKQPERMGKIQGLVTSANSYNFRTIFEGVDNHVQAQKLSGVGCDMVQGFFVGSAVGAEEFGRNLGDYAVRFSSMGNTTVILDDASLSRGEFRVG